MYREEDEVYGQQAAYAPQTQQPGMYSNNPGMQQPGVAYGGMPAGNLGYPEQPGVGLGNQAQAAYTQQFAQQYGYGGTQQGRPGGYHKPTYDDIEAGFADQKVIDFSQQAEKQARLGFIRKVYSILSMQLLLSFGFCLLTMYHQPTNNYVLTHPGLAFTGMILSFVVLIALFCYRTSYPTNLWLIGMWTLIEVYTIGTVTAAYARAGEGDLVIQALFITLSLFLALTVFCFQSKIDFSFLGGFLFAGLWVLIIWGLIGAIFGFRPGFVYSLLGAVLFSGYILFDTWMLSNKLPYDEWVLASISLYLDIINLFLFILQLLSEGRRDN